MIDVLDTQGYFATVVSPTLTDGNSIAVMTMPSSDYDHYMDGSYRQRYAFQVMAKHYYQLKAYYTGVEISELLRNKEDIPSKNKSYEFEGIEITTDPNLITRDEQYYIFGAQFSASLFIKG